MLTAQLETKLRPETSLLSLRALHMKRKVCFGLNYRSSWTDFLKRQNWHTTYTAYKKFKFPRDTTLIKVTSREDQCTFSTSSRLQFDVYPRSLTSGTIRTLGTKIISTDAIKQ